MKKIFFVFPFFLFFSFFINAQSPEISWQKPFGGSGSEGVETVKQLPDGGYLFAGGSNSGVSGNKIVPSRGDWDYWVVRTDANGDNIWQAVAGGSGTDQLRAMDVTNDGGCILGGKSKSGISSDKSEEPVGDYDYWIVKMDFVGNIIWDKTIGGTEIDELKSIQQTEDGGYVLGGMSFSGISGHKTEAGFGNRDIWIVKLDSLGNIEWDKSLGGDDEEEIFEVQQTLDGGYIIGSYSMSGISGNKTEENLGWADYWVIKLTPAGAIEWQKSYGGNDWDFLTALQPTEDGGFIFVGQSDSPISGDKTVANQGGSDSWVIKVDSIGTIEWQKSLGGDADDNPHCIIETKNGGFVIGNTSDSGISGDVTDEGTDGENSWIVMLDNLGNVMWDKRVGTSLIDHINSLEQTTDGGYILGGFSGFFTGAGNGVDHFGLYDYFILKLEGCTPTTANTTLDICNEYTDPNGDTYLDGGSYSFTYSVPNSVGCDSLITVDLTVHEETTNAIVESTCEEYTSPSGVVYNETGIYSETIANGNVYGCDSIILIDLTVTNIITTVVETDSSFVAQQDDAQYQWMDCNTNLAIAGETEQSFSPTTSGEYSVLIYQNGCSETSSCFEYSAPVGVKENEFQSSMSFFPNPTSDKLWLDLGKKYEGVTVHVNNVLGQNIKVVYFDFVEKFELNWEGGAGIYWIQIHTNDGKQKSLKVLKK